MGPKKRRTLHCLNQLQHSMRAQRTRLTQHNFYVTFYTAWYFHCTTVWRDFKRANFPGVSVPRPTVGFNQRTARLSTLAPLPRFPAPRECRLPTDQATTQLEQQSPPVKLSVRFALQTMWCLYQMSRTIFVRLLDQETTQVERRNNHQIFCWHTKLLPHTNFYQKFMHY